MKKKLLLVPLILLSLFTSCIHDNTHDYYYISKDGIIHSKKNCVKDETIICADSIYNNGNLSFCASCVSDGEMTEIRHFQKLFKDSINEYDKSHYYIINIPQSQRIFMSHIKDFQYNDFPMSTIWMTKNGHDYILPFFAYINNLYPDFSPLLKTNFKSKHIYRIVINNGKPFLYMKEINIKYQVCFERKVYNVSREKVLNDFMGFVSVCKGGTIRMRDDKGEDYDIPVERISDACKEGLYFYTVLMFTQANH
jgi:hypothetical protein